MNDALENDVRVALGAVFAEMDRLHAEVGRLRADPRLALAEADLGAVALLARERAEAYEVIEGWDEVRRCKSLFATFRAAAEAVKRQA